jgi:hypothetical protein
MTAAGVATKVNASNSVLKRRQPITRRYGNDTRRLLGNADPCLVEAGSCDTFPPGGVEAAGFGERLPVDAVHPRPAFKVIQPELHLEALVCLIAIITRSYRLHDVVSFPTRRA